jgi:hypothetical protein
VKTVTGISAKIQRTLPQNDAKNQIASSRKIALNIL